MLILTQIMWEDCDINLFAQRDEKEENEKETGKSE